MWTVTTTGDLADEHAQRWHDASVPAWDDYGTRVLELQMHGFSQEREEVTEYGLRWVCELERGTDRLRVTIERTA